MKSQSLKLFAAALVLGLVSVFGAASANAQSRLAFETSFAFHVGKDRLPAGKYELQEMNYGKYLLRSAETKESRIIFFEGRIRSTENSENVERIIFNRYGEIYFLNAVFDRRGVDGREVMASGYEKQVRKGGASRDNQLAEKKAKPEKVSLNLMK
jgi:hypothetical protein